MIRAHLIEKINWSETFSFHNDVFMEILDSLKLLESLNIDCVGIILIDKKSLDEIEEELQYYTSPEFDQAMIDQCYEYIKLIKADMKKNNESIARYYTL